jgi:hypothetical protein
LKSGLNLIFPSHGAIRMLVLDSDVQNWIAPVARLRITQH